jgi:two-component system sensor histidine kinase MtrB
VFRSFRARLIATVILLIAVTAGLVAVSSYALVRTSLRRQLVDDAVARAEFNITVLAAPDQLPENARRADFEASGLADRFLLRGTGGVHVEFADGDTYASSLGLFAAGDVVSPALRDIVAAGEFGYEFVTVDDEPTLVVGGRRPAMGPDFYFFFPASEVADTLSQLARVLLIASLSVLAIGALGAGLVARRVLRPVAVAGHAAGLMAQGRLDVRLPAETSDELGTLAIAFNQMAAALERQIEALVEAHDRERRFVADVSHELRTPLTALVNEAEHLRRRVDRLSDPDRRVAEMLVGDVDRLRRLVEDLLEVSRLDATPTEPLLSAVDLRRFLAAVVAERYPEAELHVPDSMSPIHTDRRSLERIVGNLLDNARVHAPGAPVTVSATSSVGSLEITVADAGPGVPESELPHVFDRFYTADPARRGGSGLGLAIARRHAHHLGGDLTAGPGPAGGLAFVLRIPVTESLPPRDGAETSAHQSEGGNRIGDTQ